jgi:hypothetical protein
VLSSLLPPPGDAGGTQVATGPDGTVSARLTGTDREQGAAATRLRAAAFAHGWRAVDTAEPPLVRFAPTSP